MKTSTLLALGGAGFLLWMASRSGALGAGGGGVLDNVPPGSYDPNNASSMPDYAEVTNGWNVKAFYIGPNGVDWMHWGRAPGTFGDPLIWRELNEGYNNQLWIPASRIKLSTLVKGDLERAGQFLAAIWKKGAAAGSAKQSYDTIVGNVNARLESEAEGLEIGAAIGTGLAGIFGYGAASKASDDSFGFGRGAAEDRKAIIPLDDIKTPTGDTGLESAFGPMKPRPDGQITGSEVIPLGANRVLGAYPNLFAGLWYPYDQGWASQDIPERHRIKDASGKEFVQLGYLYPWFSAEMGGHLSPQEHIYNCARMYRTLDLIKCVLYPSGPKLETVSGIVTTESGEKVPGTVTRFFNWEYDSKKFGKISGSIFPWIESDRIDIAVDPGAYAHSTSHVERVDHGAYFDSRDESEVQTGEGVYIPPDESLYQPKGFLPDSNAGASVPAGTGYAVPPPSGTVTVGSGVRR